MPPLSNVISPTGQTIYSDISCSFPPRTPDTQPPAALKWVAERAVEGYLSQLDFMQEQAATASASRAAYLFAPMSESK